MPRYRVTIEVRPGSPSGRSDDQFAVAAELLTEQHGRIAGGAKGWHMILPVDSANPLAALKRGHHLAMSIARQAGLPAGDVVRIEAVREDLVERELA